MKRFVHPDKNFFKKGGYGKTKEDNCKRNRGHPEVPEKWRNKPAAYNHQ